MGNPILTQNGFDLIYNHFNERRKGLKQLLFMLSEKYDYETELAKGCKRIIEYNFSITNEGTLSSAVSSFKSDLINQHSSIIEYTNGLKEDIINPLKSFLEDQVVRGRNLHIEIKELEREFKEIQDHLEKTKQKFHACARMAEEAKLQSEIAKNNINLSNDQKTKYANKAVNYTRDAKDAEKAYIDKLNNANNFREKYVTETKNKLDEFQLMEEKYIEFTKECLRKYFELKFIMIKSMNSDYEKRIKACDLVDTLCDVKDFIEKNSTNVFPPYKFEFIPYTSDVQTKHFDQSNYPIEIINNVKNFISKTFITEIPETEPDAFEAKTNHEIQNILNSAWDGRLTDEDRKTV